MPSPRERHRNNVKMGVFVTISLLLALGVVVALTDAWTMFTTQLNRYEVAFTLESGVSNLKKGSEVRVGGLKLGKVVTVEPRIVPNEPFQHIDVVFTLDSNVEMYSDAIVLVTSPLIGSEAWIDIPYVGTPQAGRPVDNKLEGTDRAGTLAMLLGAKNASKTSEIIENVRQFSTVMAQFPDDYNERVLPIVDNAGIFMEDARAMMAQIRHEDWPSWKPKVDVIAANLEGTSEDIREFFAWVNAEGKEKLVDALDSGRSALAQADEVLMTLRRDYDVWATELGAILANSSHASQQLKLAMTEIRRAPWKLIHVPGREELEHELLYDSVRAFALAAADLKVAANSVQRVLDTHGDRIAGDPETAERLMRNLIEPLERYKQAQERLMNVLLEQ